MYELTRQMATSERSFIFHKQKECSGFWQPEALRPFLQSSIWQTLFAQYTSRPAGVEYPLCALVMGVAGGWCCRSASVLCMHS